ncbi:MAG: hypothetical protein Q4A81_01735 [Pasteurellaceae bacterium]|nr:hypothetical protein [Pasteurellaceae bacterium]
MDNKKIKENKVTLWQFIFKMDDNYLAFLRNLMPTILFLSLALFSLGKIKQSISPLDDIVFILFSMGALFIAVSTMAVNVVLFFKKSLKVLQQLHNIEPQEPLGFFATLTLLWRESNTKLIVFFCFMMTVAIIMVSIYGINYAFNFYRTISIMAL